jgi:hypothetical protein
MKYGHDVSLYDRTRRDIRDQFRTQEHLQLQLPFGRCISIVTLNCIAG